MTEKQAEDLRRSIEKFDLVEIPAIDLDNKIIAGHQRLKILQLLGRGEEEIDVRMPNRKLSDEEFNEYNLRSNKNLGDWNWDILANFDFDLLKDVGFDTNDLNLNIDKFDIPDAGVDGNNEDDNKKGKNKIEVICPECGHKFLWDI